MTIDEKGLEAIEKSAKTTLGSYQKLSRRTAFPIDMKGDFIYYVFGLTGEVGELINKIKKIFRDDNGTVTQEKRDYIEQELGDVLWYLAQIATEFDLSLEDIAQANLEKLQSRQKRGKISGSGDYR